MTIEPRPADDLTSEELEDMILPDGRPPASLSDIHYLYGKASQLGYKPTEKAAPQEYQPLLTPLEVNSKISGEEQGIIYLNIEIDRDNQSLSFKGATVTTGTKEHIDRCAFSSYSAGNGCDYSITQKTSKTAGIDPDKSSYKDYTYYSEDQVENVLKQWPDQDHISEVAESHDKGWIITELYNLYTGKDTTTSTGDSKNKTIHTIDTKQPTDTENNPTLSEIQEKIEDQLTTDNTAEVMRLVSVRFCNKPTGSETYPDTKDHDDWIYPADMPVLLEAMKAQQTGKWQTKADDNSNATGRASGYVLSDSIETVYGMGPAPQSLYTTKKRAWMPQLNRNNAMTPRPMKAETLGALEKANEFINMCRQSAGMSIYHFPFFAGEQTTEKMRALYHLLWKEYTTQQQSAAESEESGQNGSTSSPITRFYQKANEPETNQHNPTDELLHSLRFWSVSIINVNDGRKRAGNEIKGMNTLATVDIANAAEETAIKLAQSELFDTYEWDFASKPEVSNFFLSRITSPYWFISTTVTVTDREDTNTDQAGFRFYRKLLNQKQISLNRLLSAYTERIAEEYDEGADDYRRVPTRTILKQYAQLVTLTKENLLHVDIPEIPGEANRPYQLPDDSVKRGGGHTKNSRNTTSTNQTEQQSYSDGSGFTQDTTNRNMTVEGEDTTEESDMTTDDERDDKHDTPSAYTQMITEQPALSDSPARRAAFTLGSLITRISRYQIANGTAPINSRLSPESISKHNFQDYVTEIIEEVNKYATSDGGVWRYEEQTSQLTEDLTAAPVSEWGLSSSDIQYHIALGMAFGAQSNN